MYIEDIRLLSWLLDEGVKRVDGLYWFWSTIYMHMGCIARSLSLLLDYIVKSIFLDISNRLTDQTLSNKRWHGRSHVLILLYLEYLVQKSCRRLSSRIHIIKSMYVRVRACCLYMTYQSKHSRTVLI
jgi:hypothetical protein